MSISLNQINSSVSNHESRIKKLEEASSSAGSGKMVQLLGTLGSGVGNLSDSVRNYAVIIVYANNSNSWIPFCHSGAAIEFGLSYNCPGSTGEQHNDWLFYKFNNEKQIQITSQRSMSGFRKIVGLKIYYIFRYNIYKILKLISPILKF